MTNHHRSMISTAQINIAVKSLAGIDALLALWLTRLVLKFDCLSDVIEQNYFYLKDRDHQRLLMLLGLIENCTGNKLLRGELHDIHLPRLEARNKNLETCAHQITPPEALVSNLEALAAIIGLDDTEKRILAFFIILNIDPLVEVLSGCISLGEIDVYTVLSHVLCVDASTVRKALKTDAILNTSGLAQLRQRRTNVSSLADYFKPFPLHIFERLYHDELSSDELMRECITPSPAPELCLNDFSFLGDKLENLTSFVRSIVDKPRIGVNILLHGSPGTGKTQLARCLVNAAGADSFELAIPAQNDDDNAISDRLSQFGLAQNMLRQRGRQILIFDDVEDVFNCHPLAELSANRNKSSTNYWLENNPLPTIWISNETACMDPAFTRRFDIVLELQAPPPNQRLKVINNMTAGSISTVTSERLADCESITSAVVARALKVVNETTPTVGDQRDQRVIDLVDETLAAQGHERITHKKHRILPRYFDLRYTNTQQDLSSLTQGIARENCGRMCLYGPSGTGKTAFACSLAKDLQRKLHIQRASDLVSPYVGVTEQKIAKAFRRAEQEKAILLIDEVDGFLQDRRNANYHWETTAINEILGQMEDFHGIFVATTNLMGSLDPAVLRRFDFKIEFSYLRYDQAVELLKKQCVALGVPYLCETADEQLLRSLDRLTPGDFSVATRQHLFQPFGDSRSLVYALARECDLKESNKPPKIGFVH